MTHVLGLSCSRIARVSRFIAVFYGDFWLALNCLCMTVRPICFVSTVSGVKVGLADQIIARGHQVLQLRCGIRLLG